MKKLVLVLTLLVGVGMWGYAEDIRNVPGSGNNTSIPADYGGVDVATNSFVIGLATVPSENGPQFYGYKKFYVSTTNVSGVFAQTRWTIYGVNFSTGNCANLDYVSIQVSSAAATQARELTRIYNSVVITTGTAVGANVCGGLSLLRWPLRAYGNLFWGVNFNNAAAAPAAVYNRADLLYYRESE